MTDVLSSGPFATRPRRFPSSKFTPLRPVSGLLPREPLFAELDRGADRPLPIVPGSPGSGKPTVLATWLAARPHRPAAWITCAAPDADPRRFVPAVVEALRLGLGAPRLGEST